MFEVSGMLIGADLLAFWRLGALSGASGWFVCNAKQTGGGKNHAQRSRWCCVKISQWTFTPAPFQITSDVMGEGLQMS
jgi:hypothetical protein